jgi:hypothetical protein
MKSTKKVFPYGIEYLNEKGLLHREDGPAVEWNIGDKSWLINGKYHRLDGPAREFKDGSKYWYINGKCHREDGPAREYTNGDKEWFLNGIEYSEEEWEQEVAKIKLKRILEL